MVEDVVRCRPLVVGSGWPCWHCAPSTAWNVSLGNHKRSSSMSTSVPASVHGKFTWNLTRNLSIFLLDSQAKAMDGQRRHGSKVMLPENGSLSFVVLKKIYILLALKILKSLDGRIVEILPLTITLEFGISYPPRIEHPSPVSLLFKDFFPLLNFKCMWCLGHL